MGIVARCREWCRVGSEVVSGRLGRCLPCGLRRDVGESEAQAGLVFPAQKSKVLIPGVAAAS